MSRILTDPRTVVGSRTIVRRTGITNGDFDNSPSFVAATDTSNRWINGAAAGSTTNNNFHWFVNTTTLVSSSTIRFDTSTVHTAGGASLQFNKTSGAAGTIESSSYGSTAINPLAISIQIKDCQPAAGSTKYKISCWYKQTSKAAGTVVMLTDEYDGINTARLAVSTFVSDSSTADKDWTFFSTTFTSNASTKYMGFRVGVTGFTTGTIWFDDLSIFPVARSVA